MFFFLFCVRFFFIVCIKNRQTTTKTEFPHLRQECSAAWGRFFDFRHHCIYCSVCYLNAHCMSQYPNLVIPLYYKKNKKIKLRSMFVIFARVLTDAHFGAICIIYLVAAMCQVEECQSTPVLAESGAGVSSSSLGMIAEHTLLESCTRLSISLEQNGLFKVRWHFKNTFEM